MFLLKGGLHIRGYRRVSFIHNNRPIESVREWVYLVGNKTNKNWIHHKLLNQLNFFSFFSSVVDIHGAHVDISIKLYHTSFILTLFFLLLFFSYERGSSWIGYTDHMTEGTWTWRDKIGTTGYLYTTQKFWNSGEPNNAGNEDCASMYGRSGRWNDLRCSAKISSLCEFSK